MDKFDPIPAENPAHERPIADECADNCQSISSNFDELAQLLNTIEDFIEQKEYLATERPDKNLPAESNNRCRDHRNLNLPLLKAIEELVEREKDTLVYPLDEPAGTSAPTVDPQDHAAVFPTWWVQTILQVRSAFIVALTAAVRFHLITIAQNVRLITQSPIGIDDLSGATFKRSRRYLEAFAGFRKPSKKLWEKISNLYVLRNILAHRNGMIDGSSQVRKIKAFVNREAGISIADGQLRIERAFCESALESCRRFLTELSGELVKMCHEMRPSDG